MTDPTLDWLRSEMEDARERCEALEGVDAHEWADYAARRSHEDRRAALSVLDRIGDALQKLPEEDWMIVYETISWHDDRGADLLFELLLQARRRE